MQAERRGSAVVLAGGKSSRFDFEDKSLCILHGKPLIRHVIDRVSKISDDVVVALRNEMQAEKYGSLLNDVTVGFDSVKDFGPAAGIMAGVQLAKYEYVLVVGCDMPYINLDVFSMLFDEAIGYDAAVPLWENGYVESLHAVYDRGAMMKAVSRALADEQRKMRFIIDSMKNVRYVPVEVIRKIDPELRTLYNINMPYEFDKVQK